MSTSGAESDSTQWSISNEKVYYCSTNASASNSPAFHEVPQIAKISRTTPHLIIHEQPQCYFKFRYDTEMTNSHGCLYGMTFKKSKTEKIYPEVELKKFKGEALITCNLVQVNCEEHPHRLQTGNDNNSIVIRVPQEDAYRVRFRGLCIIHTPARDVPDWVWRKHDTENLTSKEIVALRKMCKTTAKKINLNIVRLKFSAIDPDTNDEICEPVYTNAIKNIKSPTTNILKICRMSAGSSHAQGREDVIMLVEKVVKSNIMIKFCEMSEAGVEIWTANGNFLESDVFHQYAITFRTPPYRDQNITSRVEVLVKLVRPSDGQESEPRKFFYTPNPLMKHKRRRYNYSYDDQSSTSTNQHTVENVALKREAATHTEPQPVVFQSVNKNARAPEENLSPNVIVENLPQNQQLFYIDSTNAEVDNSQQHVLSIQVLDNVNQDTTGTTNTSQMSNPLPSQEEIESFAQIDFSEYINASEEQFRELLNSSNWFNDSGRGRNKINIKAREEQEASQQEEWSDGILVRMMVKHLKDMVKTIRKMDATRRDTTIVKLRDLFDIRLSNGDTFLHLTLESRQPLLDYIINLINEMDMIYLLNLRNSQMQTILHVAITQDLSDVIPFLIAKGCDPMLEDCDGNTAIHHAVMNPTCLEPLLAAIANKKVPCDLDAFNNDWQMALHLAVIYKSGTSIKLLLQHGASYNARDSDGRTPLHLAAYDDCLPAALALADHVHPTHIDEVDGRGNTALQIACNGGLKENTIEIVKLLLEKKADPLKGEYPNISAWRMVKDILQLKKVMKNYLPRAVQSNFYDKRRYINGFSSDEFESADEGDFREVREQLSLPEKLKTLSLGDV